MASVELSVALSQARTYLNDNNATVWTDANLIPCLQQADLELQMKLWNIGSPVIREMTGPLLVTAGYSPNINANLPNDFLIPTLGQECGQVTAVLTQVAVSAGLATYSYSSSAGSGNITAPAPGMYVTITGFSTGGNNVVNKVIVSVVAGTSFTVVATTQANETHAATAAMPDNNWIWMTEQYFLPLDWTLAQSTYQGYPVLTWWSWQEETIIFFGSSSNRYVNFQYRRQIPIPSGATDEIGITFGQVYLSAKGAAIAAGSVGNAAVAALLEAEAEKNFTMVLLANRGQQKPVNKP